jgi:hypothetical protein
MQENEEEESEGGGKKEQDGHMIKVNQMIG